MLWASLPAIIAAAVVAAAAAAAARALLGTLLGSLLRALLGSLLRTLLGAVAIIAAALAAARNFNEFATSQFTHVKSPVISVVLISLTVKVTVKRRSILLKVPEKFNLAPEQH
jgi:hypothetical protein